jgi:hypothetical protein
VKRSTAPLKCSPWRLSQSNGRFGRKRPIKELSIRAEDEDESTELVSLIKDRITHSEEIESEGRVPTDAERYRAVVSAWRKYSPGLRERYPVSDANAE